MTAPAGGQGQPASQPAQPAQSAQQPATPQQQAAQRAMQQGWPAAPQDKFIADDPTRPARTAVLCRETLFGHPERSTLLYHREAFYRWTGTHYEELATDTLSAMVYSLLENAVYPGTTGRGQNAVQAWRDFDVTRAKLKEIIEGMQHQVLVDRMVASPTWLNGNTPIEYAEIPAREMIACGNYLVHAGSRTVYYHTPRLMNHFAVDYDFNPNADPPRAWLNFLHDVWPDDVESIETLQEIFGYLLTRRTDLQKMFMLIGPPRSGKGTIVRVLSALLGGPRNVTSVSMAELNQPFGLEDVVDKTLAVMQDARFRSRDDGVAVERLLSITGEDPVSVNRKNKSLFTVTLPVRFLLVSNELPRLQDESGALRTRMILLRLSRTVDEARRDPHLIDKLLAELPSILNWALDGLDRVKSRRAFVQPKSAEEDLALLSALSSPTTAWMEECCHVGPTRRDPKRDVFDCWRAWCDRTGTFAGNEVHFARNLYAAASNVRSSKPWVNGKRVPHYEGICLSEEGRALLNGGVHWPLNG